MAVSVPLAAGCVMIARWILAGSVVLVVACATDPAASALVVSSTANQYVLGGPMPIEVLATNTTDRPLFLLPCAAEQRQSAGGSWQGIPNGACTAVDILMLVNPGATDTVPAFVGQAGTYRIGIRYASDSSLTAHADQSFSNSFAVVQ